MKTGEKLIITIGIVVGVILVVFIIVNTYFLPTTKEQFDKLKANFLGKYHIEKIAYASPASSLSPEYAQEKYVGKQVTIKEDSLLFADEKEMKDTQVLVREMTNFDWKDYEDKYSLGVEENKNKIEFDH
ncbi:MAG: hypothetical protein WAX04_03250 [Oscillospiraceae bacterium]